MNDGWTDEDDAMLSAEAGTFESRTAALGVACRVFGLQLRKSLHDFAAGFRRGLEAGRRQRKDT